VAWASGQTVKKPACRALARPRRAARRRHRGRVLAACESADTDEIAPLITLLRRFTTEAAREEARQFCDEIAEPPRLIYSAAA